MPVYLAGEAKGDVVSSENEDLASRVAHLEAWVEVVMRTLATLGLEGLLIELDEARGADYDAEAVGHVAVAARRAGGWSSNV